VSESCIDSALDWLDVTVTMVTVRDNGGSAWQWGLSMQILDPLLHHVLPNPESIVTPAIPEAMSIVQPVSSDGIVVKLN